MFPRVVDLLEEAQLASRFFSVTQPAVSEAEKIVRRGMIRLDSHHSFEPPRRCLVLPGCGEELRQFHLSRDVQ